MEKMKVLYLLVADAIAALDQNRLSDAADDLVDADRILMELTLKTAPADHHGPVEFEFPEIEAPPALLLTGQGA